MSKIIIALLLTVMSTPALAACPSLDINTTYSIDESVSFQFEGPEGYELQAGEVPDTLLTVNARPEGTTSMDIATGKVQAPTIRMGLTLRPIKPDNMEIHLQTAEGKPFIELPNGTKAYREDIARLDIRYYMYPQVNDQPRQLEVILMVPPQIEECIDQYEDAARQLVESISF